ncbi:MAG: hypothetical protein ACJAZH_001456, partial [Roseivirga sp.]
MRKVSILLSFLILAACSPNLTQMEIDKNLLLEGEMLFEGANTLIMANDSDLITLIEEAGLETNQVESVGLSQAK